MKNDITFSAKWLEYGTADEQLVDKKYPIRCGYHLCNISIFPETEAQLSIGVVSRRFTDIEHATINRFHFEAGKSYCGFVAGTIPGVLKSIFRDMISTGTSFSELNVLKFVMEGGGVVSWGVFLKTPTDAVLMEMLLLEAASRYPDLSPGKVHFFNE